MTKTFGNFTDLMDFSRSTTATFLGSDGLIQTAAANTPRIEYATDGTVKGLLIEEARTNLITRSETLDAAPWSNGWGGGTTLTANAATAPDGTTTADKLQQIDGGGDGVSVTLSGFSVDSYYTISCFIKNVDSTKSQLNLYNNSSNEAVNVLWNGSSVSSITTTGANVSNANYEDVGNGWIRVYATVQVKNTSVNLVLIPENTSSSSGNGAYFWGAQVEAGSFATSYIPTSGATATRAADIASIAVENFGYNQNEGTMVVEFEADSWAQNANTQGFSRVWEFTGNNGSNADGILRDPASGDGTYLRYRFNESDATTAALGPDNLNPVTGVHKVAVALGQDDAAIVMDGGTPATGSGTAAMDKYADIHLGRSSASTNFLNGHIRDFQYYPRRLTNRQLQELTGATNTYDYTTVEAGTITRTPVATGSDLVAYSGFSATNYFEQPYNSDLDFGTGDFCLMGWVKHGGSDNTIFYYGDSDFTEAPQQANFVLWTNAGKFKFRANSAYIETSDLGITSRWAQFSLTRSGGTVYLYVDGKLITSVSASSINISGDSTSDVLAIGSAFYKNNNASNALALLRISATAPTAEQIAKIYEDEKVLFQENAQATLYGSSDAVTALAHDDTTNLLHVGTSAGRSVFQGLRRVENTTDAVGTAISASNGLVVEE